MLCKYVYGMEIARRNRLTQAITEKYKGLETEGLRRLASDAGVSYSTLARYVRYKPGKDDARQVTHNPRKSTLEALALQLGVSFSWIWDGQEPKQLGLWPLLVASCAETAPSDPRQELKTVLELLEEVPEGVRIKAARAAVSAILEETVRNKCMIGPKAYRALIRLDALQGAQPAAKVG